MAAAQQFPFPASFRVVSTESSDELQRHMRTADQPPETRVCFVVEVTSFDQPDEVPGALRLYVTEANLLELAECQMSGVGDGYGNVEQFCFVANLNLYEGNGTITIS